MPVRIRPSQRGNDDARMQIEERQVQAHDLRIGMFVSRLDRPWTETPFPLQGFLILNTAQIDRIAEYCESVWIDVEKSGPAEPMPALQTLSPGANPALAM